MSASVQLEVFQGSNKVGASGLADGNLVQPPPTLVLPAPGQITLQWTLVASETSPLTASLSTLTQVGSLGPLSTQSASGITGSTELTVIENTTFALLSLVPGNPDASFATAISVKVPSPRYNLLPNGVIAAWPSAASAIPSGWVQCEGQATGIANLSARFPMACGSSATQRNEAGGGVHSHPVDVIRTTVTSSPDGHHNHSVAGFYGQWSSSRSGDAFGNPTTGAFLKESSANFSYYTNHTHKVHVTGSPQTIGKSATTTTDGAPSPLPPYFVVRFGQKVTTPT